MRFSNPFVNTETKKVAIIVTTDDYKVIDLDMPEEEARELHEKLGIALKSLTN
jgi:hypothetical protein